MAYVRDSRIPVDFSPVYFCPKCRAMHKTEKDARACDASDVAPVYQVGEIVRHDIGYRWYDGDPKWLILNTGDVNGRKTHSAYFIITAIDYERGSLAPHEPRYHLKTLGIKNGHETGLIGFTRIGTHKTFDRVPQDPALIEEGKKFIGEKTEHLL